MTCVSAPALALPSLVPGRALATAWALLLEAVVYGGDALILWDVCVKDPSDDGSDDSIGLCDLTL